MGVLPCCFALDGNAVDAGGKQKSHTAVQRPSRDEPHRGLRHPLNSSTDEPTGVTPVGRVLSKVRYLIEGLVDAKADKLSGLQSIKQSLSLILEDCGASYISVMAVSEDQKDALVIATAPKESVVFSNQQLQPCDSSTSFGMIVGGKVSMLSWSPPEGDPKTEDWRQLTKQAGLKSLWAVPLKSRDKIRGVLTVGFAAVEAEAAKSAGWCEYLQLVAAMLGGGLHHTQYIQMRREMQKSEALNGLVQCFLQSARQVLGHQGQYGHVWFRLALASRTSTTVTLFDDLSQLPDTRVKRHNSFSGSLRSLVKEVLAGGGVIRTSLPMKNTVVKVALANKKQVLIPDVQKLVNQMGNVTTDLFSTSLMKPPSSVLVLPVKTRLVMFGALYCMSSVPTDFKDHSARLKEMCELCSDQIHEMLTSKFQDDYQSICDLDDNDLKVSCSEGSFCLDSPRGQVLKSPVLCQDGSQSGGILTVEGRSSSSNHRLYTGRKSSFSIRKVVSSTGSLVMGLTDKLNHKRIVVALDEFEVGCLQELQLEVAVGSGGFAKVFRGHWRGLVVGVKVVHDIASDDKAVMKNAHEIALLAALSHPSIIQAYCCITDVPVLELMDCCKGGRSGAVAKQLSPRVSSAEESSGTGPTGVLCHVEILELCDMGNLSTANRAGLFSRRKESTAGEDEEEGGEGKSEDDEQAGSSEERVLYLLLTLIEIAGAMAYLHKMGVVHCDLKPANVLLKSCRKDPRGFITKVSDFGLSRVEDDDSCCTFPFNSCGTAPYVAPEALVCSKKVNSSVDVYAFGIMMWELWTGERPYGRMKQQQVVEDVVLKGLRPRFPAECLPQYSALAKSCWNTSPGLRPTFQDVLKSLCAMKSSLEENNSSNEGLAAIEDDALAIGEIGYEEAMRKGKAQQNADVWLRRCAE